MQLIKTPSIDETEEEIVTGEVENSELLEECDIFFNIENDEM